MSEQLAFGRLVAGLSPWLGQLVFVGGWAFRLYRLHPSADSPAYRPVVTLDADVAFAEGERLEGNIRARLLDTGFVESLMGNHRPPVSKYMLGEDASGFYAEFLTPLSGSGRRRDGEPMATVAKAGVTAQRLRHLALLLEEPWQVTLGVDWGVASDTLVRIPNPASFIAQRLLIHDQRPPAKRAQDILYIHDTLELFGGELDALGRLWRATLLPTLHARQQHSLRQVVETIFGSMDDRIRDAAATPADRQLDPEQMRQMCRTALVDMLAVSGTNKQDRCR